MFVGIGIDVMEIEKVREIVLNYPRQIDSIFTPAELSFCRKKCFHRYSMLLAAKEAILKALQTGWERGSDYLDIEIIPLEKGQFAARLFSGLKEKADRLKVKELKGSFAFSREAAIAQVLALN